ncbi:hypothetical protein N658DRAFT_495331 [Parathielavia hyrcaniae]|uniref:Uncharacterized protein n=1 Tax=Parathielavia hyrcaniae TaxID=113614 RepID=A0AAN6Q327_9PEZI|nr:hypothetical protein N658DRAFT_495331 [Parathielavia hyrcaniae]
MPTQGFWPSLGLPLACRQWRTTRTQTLPELIMSGVEMEAAKIDKKEKGGNEYTVMKRRMMTGTRIENKGWNVRRPLFVEPTNDDAGGRIANFWLGKRAFSL